MATKSSHREPRKRLPAAERRELIERAALELFAERGYRGASVDEIARRAGVTPPVFYDHFESKLSLHRRLLERTREELLAMWRQSLAGGGSLEQQVARALDAWSRYVETHPYAPRMFFRETTGVEEIRRVHRQISAQANGELVAIIVGLAPARSAGARDNASPLALALASEIIRGGLTELAIWWSEHPEVPRKEIVAAAMNTVWIGFERFSAGEAWVPSADQTA